jgi:hypothetical protein
MKTITDCVKISMLMLLVLAAMSVVATAQAIPPSPPLPVPTPLSAPLVLTATPTTVISGVPINVTFTVLYGSSLVSGATIILGDKATGTGTTNANGTVTINVKATGVGAITATVTKAGYANTTYDAILTSTMPTVIVFEILIVIAIVTISAVYVIRRKGGWDEKLNQLSKKYYKLWHIFALLLAIVAWIFTGIIGALIWLLIIASIMRFRKK